MAGVNFGDLIISEDVNAQQKKIKTTSVTSSTKIFLLRNLESVTIAVIRVHLTVIFHEQFHYPNFTSASTTVASASTSSELYISDVKPIVHRLLVQRRFLSGHIEIS